MLLKWKQSSAYESLHDCSTCNSLYRFKYTDGPVILEHVQTKPPPPGRTAQWGLYSTLCRYLGLGTILPPLCSAAEQLRRVLGEGATLCACISSLKNCCLLAFINQVQKAHNSSFNCSKWRNILSRAFYEHS